MEELSTKRNQNVANQATSSRDESVGIVDESEKVISIEIPDEASSESSGASQNSQSDQKRRRIEKVPLLLRKDKNNEGCYDPQVVSLGPYHHGKKELKFVEDFKPTVLQMFVSDSGKHRDEFYNAVLEVIEDARSFYVQGSTEKYNDDEFANMMLLDGCFILFFIDLYTNRHRYGMLEHHLGFLTLSMASMDMFLLENQLPFQILQVLMSLKFKENKGKEMIDKFIEIKYSRTMAFQNKQQVLPEADDQPFHLYEALRTRTLLKERILWRRDDQPFHTLRRTLWDRFYQVLINQPLLIHTFRPPWDGLKKKSHDMFDMKEYIHSFRSVTELKAKGIFVRSSGTLSFHDIKFKSYWFYGQLQLPWCFIGSSSKTRFLNDIAFEMCPMNPTDREITSYVAFMKSIIDHPDDVRELRSKRILLNRLGSDEEVVQMFKEINTYDLDRLNAYENVKDSIQRHYNSEARTWTAELFFTYFSSPWKTIALLGGILLLLLTVLQTDFSWKALQCKLSWEVVKAIRGPAR